MHACQCEVETPSILLACKLLLSAGLPVFYSSLDLILVSGDGFSQVRSFWTEDDIIDLLPDPCKTLIERLSIDGSEVDFEDCNELQICLPRLKVLKVGDIAIKGKLAEWETLDNEKFFIKLDGLKGSLLDLSQWYRCMEIFPQLFVKGDFIVFECLPEDSNDNSNGLRIVSTLRNLLQLQRRSELTNFIDHL